MQMLKYKPVPKWWFGCILVISFAIAQATTYAGKSHMPWWALIVVLVIAFVVSLYETDLKARIGLIHPRDLVHDRIQFPCGRSWIRSILLRRYWIVPDAGSVHGSWRPRRQHVFCTLRVSGRPFAKSKRGVAHD
jgi:hypothetical protein